MRAASRGRATLRRLGGRRPSWDPVPPAAASNRPLISILTRPRPQVMRRYHIQDRDDYKKYNKLVGLITKLTNLLR